LKKISLDKPVSIFFLTTLAIYAWFYFRYGELFNLAKGGNTTMVLLKEVRDYYEFWKNDNVASSLGPNGHWASIFFWAPILISDLFNIPIGFLEELQRYAVPILTLFIFYKIAGNFYESEIDKFIPVAIISVGNWKLFNLSLASIPINLLSSYSSDVFYIFFLASLLFFFKKDLLKTGASLFICVLGHPALGLMAGIFLIICWAFIHQGEGIKPLAKLALIFFISLAIEYALLKICFFGEAKVSSELAWDLVLNHGHNNYLNIYPVEAAKSALLLIILTICAYFLCDKKILKKTLLCGVIFLLLMYVLYLIGFHFQSNEILKIAPLRFSNLFIWLIVLCVKIPREKVSVKGFYFFVFISINLYLGRYAFLHLFRYPYTHYNFSTEEFFILSAKFLGFLVGGIIVSVLTFEVKSINSPKLIPATLMSLALISPFGLREDLEWPKLRKYHETLNYIRTEIGSGKKFLVWNSDQLRYFSPLTKNLTINPDQTGLWTYTRHKSIYDQDILKTNILMEEKPMSFKERRQKAREATQQPFSQKYNNYYQKHFDPEYLIGGPTVESIGNIIYSNTYFKIYRLPKN
jgi:hypothetical protein